MSASIESAAAAPTSTEHTSRLGMWVFLASELLFFGAFFLLYAGLRAQHVEGFREGVAHADRALGGINTFVLLGGSYFAASAVRAARVGHRTGAALRAATTMLLAVVFLVLKSVEYAHHVTEGMVPGGHGAFFEAHPTPGLASYVALYWITTFAHALHVAAGAIVMGTLALGCARRPLAAPLTHRVELGALYWHLVDVIWLFVWTLFYLVRG